MHTFHHHNGIIDHNGDGKHESRKGEKVQREANEIEHQESANQCHWNGNGGDERRTEILEEDENNQEHEDEGFDKSLHNFVNGGKEEVVDILSNTNFQSCGHGGLAFFKSLFDVLNNLCCVGTCNLRYHAPYRLMSVGAATKGVGFTAEFDTSDVFQADEVAIGIGFDDDVFKLSDFLKATSIAEGVLESLVFAFTDITRGSFDVLFCQNSRYVRGDKTIRSHFFGIEPNAHGIRTRKYLSITYTRYALHLRNEVNLGIVFQEVRGIAIFSVDE